MPMLSVSWSEKWYVGQADLMSAVRPMPPAVPTTSMPTTFSRKGQILYTTDPIDHFRMWCVVWPLVSQSQRLEEYLSWGVSIDTA